MAGEYRELVVWQQAMELVKQIYSTTKAFPRDEIYGLTSQLRRASVSVASNIAEGQGRDSRPEFYQFLSKARGSLMEIETQILISTDLGYINRIRSDALLASATRVGQLLNGLMRSVKARSRVS
jgi:four helix bundle protein